MTGDRLTSAERRQCWRHCRQWPATMCRLHAPTRGLHPNAFKACGNCAHRPRGDDPRVTTQAGETLQLYVKASNARPWRDRAGALSASGLGYTVLGEIIAGPVSVKSLKDGGGNYRRLAGICELFGAAQACAAQAYLVKCADREQIFVVGGQLGLLFAGEPRPLLRVASPGDLPQDVALALGI